MLVRVLTALVLTQEATPRLVLEQWLSALDQQARPGESPAEIADKLADKILAEKIL